MLSGSNPIHCYLLVQATNLFAWIITVNYKPASSYSILYSQQPGWSQHQFTLRHPSPEPSAGIHATAPCDLRNLDDWVPWPVSPSRNPAQQSVTRFLNMSRGPFSEQSTNVCCPTPWTLLLPPTPQNLPRSFLSFLKGHLSVQLPGQPLWNCNRLPCTLPYFLPPSLCSQVMSLRHKYFNQVAGLLSASLGWASNSRRSGSFCLFSCIPIPR